MSRRVAIFASGEGTTAEAFIRACAAGQVAAEVVLVICNKPAAGIFDRVANLNDELRLNITVELIGSKNYPAAVAETVLPGGQTRAEVGAIQAALQAKAADLVLLMGYLRRVSPELVRDYGWRAGYTSMYQANMLNTHPGLLPATKGLWGLHVQEYVIAQRHSYGGQTLHIVAEDYDDGPVVAEHQVAVESGDTPDEFFDRVKAAEKHFLPLDLQAFIEAQALYNHTKIK